MSILDQIVRDEPSTDDDDDRRRLDRVRDILAKAGGDGSGARSGVILDQIAAVVGERPAGDVYQKPLG